jgi:hypothetical protein
VANAAPEKVEKRIREVRALEARLRSEGEVELAAKLAGCGESFVLTCIACKTTHPGRKQCKKKWCPRCCVALTARRNDRMKPLVERFKWPLFVTLTQKNVETMKPEDYRKLRRAFGKLRHRRFWKENVVGGLACIEVTNIGNGFHPHLHAILDCRWLAIKTPRPQKGDSRETIKAKCKAAAAELESNWAKCLGQTTASVKVKRCSASGITKEVIKYALKGSDLLSCSEKIGPLIHALNGTRLMTTFGSMFGAKVEEPESVGCESASPFKCCSDPQWRPGAAGTVASWGYEDLVKQGKKSRTYAVFCECGKKGCISENLEPEASSFTGSPGGADLTEGVRRSGRSGAASGQFQCQRS